LSNKKLDVMSRVHAAAGKNIKTAVVNKEW
jgi:hypothetical protein